MNGNQINALPTHVREIFLSIPDSTFADDEAVIELRDRLSKVEAEHQVRAAQVCKIKDLMAAQQVNREAALAEINRLESLRPAILADAFVADNDFSTDDEILGGLREQRLLVERIDLAAAGIEGFLAAAQTSTGQTANQSFELGKKLETLLDELRMEMAQSRAYS